MAFVMISTIFKLVDMMEGIVVAQISISIFVWNVNVFVSLKKLNKSIL